MALPHHHTTNFRTMLAADKTGQLCLMECTENATGEKRAVICVVNPAPNDELAFYPVAVMLEGNPYDDFTPPE